MLRLLAPARAAWADVRARFDVDDARERGSLILDIMIGMAIFALIASITMSGIGSYRARVYEQGVVADAYSIAMAFESDLTDNFNYPAALDAPTLAAAGLNLSKGNKVAGYDVDGDSFVVCIDHGTGTDVDAYAIYDSAFGTVTDKGRSGGCVGKVLDAGNTPVFVPPTTVPPTPTLPPTPTTSPTPTVPAVTYLKPKVMSVGAGSNKAAYCAIDQADALYCWGYNTNGAVGDGTTTAVAAPTRIGTSTWKTVSTRDHSCGIKTDGTMWCWGKNDQNQAATGATTNVLTPTQVGTATDWVDVAVSYTSSCGIRAGGVYCWGWVINNGSTSMVYASPTLIASGTGYTSIRGSDGSSFYCATKTDQNVRCFGYTYNGETGTGTTGNIIIQTPQTLGAGPGTYKDYSIGAPIGCAVATAGTLWCWGNADSGVFPTLGGGNGAIATPYQIGTATDWSKVLVQRDSGGCAIKTTGTLWCWGAVNLNPTQVGTATDWARFANNSYGILCAIKTDDVAYCATKNANTNVTTLSPASIVMP